MLNLKQNIESILFIHGEPISVSRIAKMVGAPKKDAESMLRELQAEYRERGIVLIENGEEWQFATSPGTKAVVEKFFSGELPEELSRASLEVLSIIAYKGPISRANIEFIRGVNSDFTLRNLLIRGLVVREENAEDRRSYLYRISADLLKFLGLESARGLPHFEELRRQEVEVPSTEESQEPQKMQGSA